MERYLIIGLIINASIAVGGFLPACFQEHECYVSIISLDKVEKGPVKLAFICTFMIMVEINFLCYFTHFLSIIILFSLSFFSLLILWVWLETIFSCIKFALHAFWYGVEAMICLELERH